MIWLKYCSLGIKQQSLTYSYLNNNECRLHRGRQYKKALKMLAIFLLVNTADYDYLHINY